MWLVRSAALPPLKLPPQRTLVCSLTALTPPVGWAYQFVICCLTHILKCELHWSRKLLFPAVPQLMAQGLALAQAEGSRGFLALSDAGGAGDSTVSTFSLGGICWSRCRHLPSAPGLLCTLPAHPGPATHHAPAPPHTLNGSFTSPWSSSFSCQAPTWDQIALRDEILKLGLPSLPP